MKLKYRIMRKLLHVPLLGRLVRKLDKSHCGCSLCDDLMGVTYDPQHIRDWKRRMQEETK